MKWKTALGPEDAVLFMLGLEEYESMERLQLAADPVPLSEGFNEPHEGLFEKWEIACQIHDSLMDEIFLAVDGDGISYISPLEIISITRKDDGFGSLMPETALITKKSLAEWIYPMDRFLAEKLYTQNVDLVKKNVQLPIDLNKKAENSYINTIYALSEALIDGLTGHPHSDAAAVLKALDLKGIERPIGEAALANYLKKAFN